MLNKKEKFLVKEYAKKLISKRKLNEAKADTWKGSEIYPIGTRANAIGKQVKDFSGLVVGSKYVLWEPGMDVWQADYKFTGKFGRYYIFEPLDVRRTEGDAMEFTGIELSEYITDGYVFHQN